MLVHIDDNNFNEVISKGVVLLDFYADWCGPCRMQTPILENLANEMQGKMIVAKLDVDSSQKTTASFSITSIPTMILFKDGKELQRIVGLKDLDSLKKIVSPVL